METPSAAAEKHGGSTAEGPMNGIARRARQNWKTTAIGLLSALAVALQRLSGPWPQVTYAISTVL
jgi:hypothetical protein